MFAKVSGKKLKRGDFFMTQNPCQMDSCLFYEAGQWNTLNVSWEGKW